jgi:hypothetical protein
MPRNYTESRQIDLGVFSTGRKIERKTKTSRRFSE